jgi:hypothetical protein
MKAYAVRQKSTGYFIPILKRGFKRGGSHSEPTNDSPPRIFPSALSARSFLGNWLQGIFENDYSLDYNGNEDFSLRVTPQPHRKKNDMEIVEFDLVETK